MRAYIVADGGFGAEVADHLVTLLRLDGSEAEVVTEPLVTGSAATLANWDVSVRVSWRDIRTEFDGYAEAALAAGRPFVPVALGHPYVRVGPAVVPGRAPCHRCYALRVRQHANARDAVNDECEDAMRRDPRLGVTGHPPHVACVAAGLVLGMVRQAGDGGSGVPTGRLTRIDCVTDEIAVWSVTPAHGCPTCGPVVDPQTRAKAGRDRLRELAARMADGPPREAR